MSVIEQAVRLNYLEAEELTVWRQSILITYGWVYKWLDCDVVIAIIYKANKIVFMISK